VPLKDLAQESQSFLEQVLILKGVLGAGTCFSNRTCQITWNSPDPPQSDAIWTSLGDTFSLLKLHRLPSKICEWHWETHSIFAAQRDFGVVGVVCSRADFADLAPRLQALLNCESLPLGRKALEVQAD
jgi:hypothetical protein